MKRASVVVTLVLTAAQSQPIQAQATAQPAAAAETAEPEDLRKEVRELRTQLQSLRAAMSEAVEFDRLRANALSRALGTPSDAPSLPREKPERPIPGRPSGRPAAPSVAPAAPRRSQAPSLERPDPAGGGTVRGKVDVPSGEPVAYVFIENIRGPVVRGDKVKIDQMNKQFVPSWAVVQRGTAVEFPNNDNIYHNVFSLSTGNAFDLGLYNSGGEAKSHVFSEPGAVDVYCNIHPQMAASVLVVPNRHFAKVKPDGSFDLAGVPAGRRKISAWAPGSRLSSEWVEVPAGASADVALRLERKSGSHRNKLGKPYGSYQ